MTRINVVPVQELCDQHLLAEHREITRIPNGLLSGKLKYRYSDQPSEYTLGKGHVKFFVNKLGFLSARYIELYLECRARNFGVSFNWPGTEIRERWDALEDMRLAFLRYVPTEAALALNRERIEERMPAIPRFTLTSGNGHIELRSAG